MFTNLKIRNLRGFRALDIASLERVNLFVGTNDVGKTTLLEAVFLLIGETNIALILKINGFRGLLPKIEGDASAISDWLWTPLFCGFDTNSVITVQGLWDDHEHCIELRIVPLASAKLTLDQATSDVRGSGTPITQALQLDYADGDGRSRQSKMLVDERGVRVEPPPPLPMVPGYFHAARTGFITEEDARNLGQIEVEKKPFELLKVLQIIEPRLKRVSAVVGPGGSMIYGDIGLDRMLPLALMGDGLARFTSILLKIATAPHGVVLIDEMENGFHHAILPRIWQAIAAAARLFDVQIFATTHSWECVRAAHEAFSASSLYDFGLHRLETSDDGIRDIAYDRETLDTALTMELEVR